MKKILLLILTLCSFSGMVYSDISWSAPVAISTALTNALDPHVAIDSNGNVTAAWVENSVIKTSSLPSGGSWSAPISLSNSLNTASSPRLGVDSSGNVIAIWIENLEIESAILPFGGSWSAETSPISGSGASNPALAVDSSGNAVAVWARSNFIESSTRPVGTGTWSLTSVLSATNSSNPDIAISSFGTAMAIWHSVVSGSDVIVTDILTISSNTWAATKNVFTATAAFNHNYPKIALDSNGNAAIAWYRYNFVNSIAYSNVQVLTASLTQGANAWGSPAILSNSGMINPANLTIRLKFDTSGNALAVWTNSYDGETYSVESAQKIFGGSWPASVLPQNPSLYSFGIDMVTASGTALLVNMTWDGVSNIQIQSQESDTTDPVIQAWTHSNVFSTGSDNGYPMCAMSLQGSTLNAAAVWISFNGSNTVIDASTGSDTLVASPSSVSATQSVTNFGVYNDYFNTITWSASSDPNVIQYNIFRNGVYFTATSSSTLQFIDHNQVQGGAVTYGVAALRSDFRQSAIVSFTLF